MLELNQPNHAYDLDTLGGGGFRVRTRGRRRADDHARRQRAHVHRGRSVDLRRRRPPDRRRAASWAGSTPRSPTRRPRVALEIAWFEPLGDRADRRPARAALGGVGPLRARLSTRTGSTLAIARFAELLARDLPRPRRARRRRRRPRRRRCPPSSATADVRISQVNRILGTALAADDLPPLLDPIGYTVTGDGRRPHGGAAVWRPDSTEEIDVVEEVARHYGYDRLGKTVPTSIVHGGLDACASSAAGWLREVLLGLGISEAMPNPFLAPDTLERGRARPTESLRSPTRCVDEESVLRTSLRPGLLQAIAFNESHRRSRRAAVRDRPRLPARRGRAAGRVRGVVRRARRRGGARRRSRCGASCRRCARRRRAHRPVEGPGRAASPLGRRRCRPASDPTRWRRRGPPGRARRVRRVRAGRDPRARPRSAPRPRAEAGGVEADQPVPVERPRPRVRACPTTCRPSGSRRRSGRAPASCSSTSTLFDVYRGRSRARTARRSLAYRLRLQAPDRNLTDADIAEVRRGRRGRGDEARCRPAKLTR